MNRIYAVVLLLISVNVEAAGYEPSLPFGAQTAGVAGIGSPYITGSQALFFNPAGLAGDKPGQDVSLNLSPGWGIFKGPVIDPNMQISSQKKVLVPFGLMYGRTVNEQWGWGAGVYVSGGAYADFPNVDLTPGGVVGSADLKSDLTIMEFAGGVGYKVMDGLMDGLKIGAAWRVAMVSANFSSVQYAGLQLGNPTFVSAQYSNLKDTNYLGYKLGAQYKYEEFNLGLVFRSAMNFKAKGTATNMFYSQTAPMSLAGGNVTVGSVFPAAVNLGATFQATDHWKILGEYVWTEYSSVTNLAINEDGYSPQAFPLQWQDQHEFRVAGEYSGRPWPIRFGYIWSSAVTNSNYANPTFTPPGSFNTLTVGTGNSMTLGQGNTLQYNGALEYGWSSGTGSGMFAQYAVNDYGFHFGLDYLF